ncbi:amidohydrolase family protein [Microbacterium horticulturae]|uniref:Amidohydrolase family protein n=1 Tax=Microbacterium horticulturae TaxID=3028316 RepID=A0ABY8BZJ1_9MICO|nr:amidohydrolase family protein [Microbacterium sp. KACC 23027]WEG08415.1 amidohydrolase family protein [Microbacterium sp. KACC 23027]
MRIDVHAHYWARSYIDLLVAAGRRDLAFAGQENDLGERLAEMDRLGVDVQLFSAVGLNTEVEDAAASLAATQHINDLYATIAIQSGGRFGGFASLPLPHVDAAIAEADRAIDELGLAGIALPCLVGGVPIDDAAYAPLWEHLGRKPRSVAVYVHPVGTDSNAHPGLEQFGLNMLLGSTTQIAMAALRVGLSGITTRHPNISFIFALCGGTLPYLWQRYERNLHRGLDMSAVKAVGAGLFAWMDELPFERDDPMGLFRRNTYFDTSVQDIPAALRLTKQALGVERILLGSDAIFASLTEAVEMVQGCADLTDDDKHRILDVNAQELLRLPIPEGR